MGIRPESSRESSKTPRSAQCKKPAMFVSLSCVLCIVRCPVLTAVLVQREVLLYGRATWTKLRQAISNHDWSSDIVHGDADESAKRFEERLPQFVHKFIPRKVISDEK